MAPDVPLVRPAPFFEKNARGIPLRLEKVKKKAAANWQRP
jgi:hypothetical protein